MNFINTNIKQNSINAASDQREVGDVASEVGDEDRVLAREFSRDRIRGFVVHCDSEYAIISTTLEKEDSKNHSHWAVGQLLSIKVGVNRVVAMTVEVNLQTKEWNLESENTLLIKMELVGEIKTGASEKQDTFTNGITNYPQMGCVAHRIRSGDLATIYRSEGDSVVKIGHLTQDPSVEAKIDIDKLLSRHFAIVGTTGVGKSTSVALILKNIITKRPDIRVLVLDPHNEFSAAFPDTSVLINSDNLLLPCWLFKRDELADVIFKGQQDFDIEVELLGELIAQAKENYRFEMENQNSGLSIRKEKAKKKISADLPIPYRLTDLIQLIDDRFGMLENKSEIPHLKMLKSRIEGIRNDPRFNFMFDVTQGGDIMENIISKIFRVPQNGKPIAVLEMSGLPSEVVNAAVSVLCRMAFDLAVASDGGIQTLVVCEEAHRYIPQDRTAGFFPTQLAVGRIAKEGRKYGVSLGIISQRPGELDSTIVSQCNTIFAMRLGNSMDQEIIKNAVTNGAKSTIGFLSSISNRECIAFGEAVHTPIRMTFETLAENEIPGSDIIEKQEAVKNGLEISLHAVLKKIRHEDKSCAENDGFFNIEQRMPETSYQQPGDEINSLVDAVSEDGSGQEVVSAQENAMRMNQVIDRETIDNTRYDKHMKLHQQREQEKKLNPPVNSHAAPKNQQNLSASVQSTHISSPHTQQRAVGNGDFLNNIRSKL